jgi:hypothetical protein
MVGKKQINSLVGVSSRDYRSVVECNDGVKYAWRTASDNLCDFLHTSGLSGKIANSGANDLLRAVWESCILVGQEQIDSTRP